ncbi:cytochrome P450 [Thermaurantiacus sp.]
MDGECGSGPIPGFLDLLAANPDYSRDPEAQLGPLRRCPVHRDPLSRHVLLSRYADARRILNDDSLWRHPSRADPESIFARFVAVRSPPPDTPPGERSSILLMDAPDHRRIRAPLQKAFHARVFRARPLIEAVIHEALGGVAGRAAIDLVAELAIPIPIHAIAAILGVARDRLLEFRQWSEAIILTLNPFRSAEEESRAQAAAEALHGHFRELMAARRRASADDLVSDMVEAQAGGAPLSDTEIILNLTALLVGGNLTTTDLIASGVRLLLEHPAELRKLRADPALAAAAVEETLRLEGPVDFTPRIAPGPIEIGGETFDEGTPLFALLRAANRDPEVFPDPDRFDLSRRGAPHLAFGGGAHSCIGAALARLEARLFLSLFFERFPAVSLPPQAFAWRRLPGFRGLERLEVVLGPPRHRPRSAP